MNLKQALEHTVAIQVTSGLLDKALLDAELSASEDYVKATHQEKIDLCAIDILMAVKALKSISEGSFTYTIDPAAVDSRLLFLATKYNLTDLLEQLAPKALKPTITNATNRW